jgi:hypothetical protein
MSDPLFALVDERSALLRQVPNSEISNPVPFQVPRANVANLPVIALNPTIRGMALISNSPKKSMAIR